MDWVKIVIFDFIILSIIYLTSPMIGFNRKMKIMIKTRNIQKSLSCAERTFLFESMMFFFVFSRWSSILITFWSMDWTVDFWVKRVSCSSVTRLWSCWTCFSIWMIRMSRSLISPIVSFISLLGLFWTSSSLRSLWICYSPEMFISIRLS